MAPHLVIVGASIRAAAWSAARAGLTVSGGDLFADVDTARFARVVAVEKYPDGLAEVVRGAPPGPWMYTGALENYPELVDHLAGTRPLWGCRGDTLRRARDPAVWGTALAEAGLPAPRFALSPQGLPTDGSYLAKRLRASGGGHVQVYRGQALSPAAGGWFWQEHLAGRSLALLAVADGRRAWCWGVVEQLVGTPWTGAAGFQYAGAVGPLSVSPLVMRQFTQIANQLAERLGLVGLWGIDGILIDEHPSTGIDFAAPPDTAEQRTDGVSQDWGRPVTSGVFVPVEINPRLTASMEILERAGRRSALGLHAAACSESALPADDAGMAETPASDPSLGPIVAKAIVFAQKRLTVSPTLAARLAEGACQSEPPIYADVPAAGATFEPLWPVATVLAQGPNAQYAAAQLMGRVSGLSRSLESSADMAAG